MRRFRYFFIIATLALSSLVGGAAADHSPSSSGYHYRSCSHSGGTYHEIGNFRAYFNASSNDLNWWRYRMYNYPVNNNKNNFNLLEWHGGSPIWYYYSPDSLVNQQNAGGYLQLPWLYSQNPPAGHISFDNSWRTFQGEFVFDSPGADPKCTTSTMP